MAAKKSILRRVRLVYRQSSTALKCVVLAMVVLCTVVLMALGISIRQTKQQTEQIRDQAAKLEQDNQQLIKNIAELGTVQSVIRIAREELGLELPDVIIFDPVQSTDP